MLTGYFLIAIIYRWGVLVAQPPLIASEIILIRLFLTYKTIIHDIYIKITFVFPVFEDNFMTTGRRTK